ncbi:hypothetical protein JW916_06895 [Candidatus Sumerlaeota bacterium]|nr:hypothetical protein [Candidatus Sumerlaeota bacterium]
MKRMRQLITLRCGETRPERWLAGLTMLALLGMAGGLALAGDEASEGVLAPDGFKAVLEVEDMTSTNTAVEADDPGLHGGTAVRFIGLNSIAAGTIALDPGMYEASLHMLRPDGDHDAVTFSIGGSGGTRVYRSSDDLGPVEQFIRFSVEQAGDAPVEIRAVETGMLLDKVVITRLSNPTSAAEPKPEPEVE